MKTTKTIYALAAILCAGTLARGEEARPLPIDEAKIQAEMEALQDGSAPTTPGQAEEAARLVREGVKQHDEGKPDAAIAKYREAISIAPLHAVAYYELAYSLALAGRQAEGLEAITRALVLDPKEEQYYVLKGNVLDNLGFVQAAEATYRALLDVMPDSYMGLINLGICQMRSSEHDEAERSLVRARDLAPDLPSAYFHLATLARLREFNYEEEALLKQFLARGKNDRRTETVSKRLEEIKQIQVTMDPAEPFPHISLAIAAQRGLWRGEEHRKRHPEARGYRLTFEEEKAILGELLLPMWREQKRGDPAARHGFYDLVLAVDDAGFLDEYIYYTKQKVLGDSASAWLAAHPARIQAFLAWARTNGHLREEPPPAAGDKGNERPSGPAQLLRLLTESKVHYAIGAEVENAAQRFLEQESQRFRKGLDLAGGNRVACSERGDYAARTLAHELGLAETILRCHAQEGPARQRALAQLTNLGTVARDTDLQLDGGVFEKGDEVQIVSAHDRGAQCLAYWMAKAAWPREASLREAVAGKGASSPSVEEEMYALAVSAEGYTNSLASGVAAAGEAKGGENEERAEPQAAWDELVRVVNEGHLRGFVLYEILGRRYGMSLERLSDADAAALDRYLRTFVEQQVGR